MRTLVNPQQTRLFDPFGSVLTQQTRQRLMENWPGVFRHVLLELMPAGALAEHFDPVMGRPSKELYAMAGLIFLKECFNWSNDDMKRWPNRCVSVTPPALISCLLIPKRIANHAVCFVSRWRRICMLW